MKMHEIIAREEDFWRYRSRALWLSVGDKNTRYFHFSMSKHRDANIISHIVSNGNQFEKDDI